MTSDTLPIVFGPIRTRRLGWSLGVNNIRPKTCTYSCVYCQLGRTTRARCRPEPWLDPADIACAVQRRIRECRQEGERIDAITFVPDGEPTLDARLGESIRAVRGCGPLVAVISNGSLLTDDAVQAALSEADWVSLKVDTVDAATWHRLDRPVHSLDLEAVLASMRRFADRFRGSLVTETMLVDGVNDDAAAVERTARFVRSLEPWHAYLTVPIRPGAEPWVRPPPGAVARAAAAILSSLGIRTSLLCSDETVTTTAGSGDPAEGLLGILAVHPLRERLAREYLEGCGGERSAIDGLIEQGVIVRIVHDGSPWLRVDHARRGLHERKGPGAIPGERRDVGPLSQT